MSFEEACEVIRDTIRIGDTLEETFVIICHNRYSHPVRDWAIYDMQQQRGLSRDSAKRLYNMHLKRLFEIFDSH